MKIKTLLISMAAMLLCFSAGAQRYCNPLPMPIGQGGVASGDVSIFQDDDGTYYMYCTGGGAWVSKDLFNWDFHHVDNIPIAPDFHK